ncbi:MAG TPA: hypothetical protein VND45_01445 [Thermoanaerobaculia bacterium]|jgi:hypothetical protein|nr:hypothetical protein [Thermoanaerobaculia bacterium]
MRQLALLLLLATGLFAEERTLTIYVSPEHPYSLAFDRDTWTSNDSDEKDVDLVLTHRGGKAFAALYVLTGDVTLDALRETALKNGRAIARDLKVVSEERVKKGDAGVLLMHTRGTSPNGPVEYRGVYWAGAGQAIQLVATTTKEADADVKELLDGLTIRVEKPEQRAFTVDYSPLTWRVLDDGSKDGTMLFAHKAGDLQAIATAVRSAAAPPTIRAWVLEQAKALAPDAKIVSEEPKTLDGRKITMMRLEGKTTDRVDVVMLGYFYSGNGAYVEVVTFTPRARFAQRQADMLELLDSLRIHLPRE